LFALLILVGSPKNGKKSEAKWKFIFFILLIVWALVLLITVFARLSGVYGLVDTSVDLSYITISLLAIVMVYTAVTFFVHITHLLTINKARKYQEKHCSLSKTPADGSTRNHDYFKEELCSIVIPSRNEESVIRRTVTECLKQTHRNIEVIVVCHNCNDGTFEAANIGDSRVRAFNLTTKEAGKGIALNYGVEKAKGKYLLILDGDGLLSRDFIEKALPMFRGNYAAVQGRYFPSNRNYNFLTKLLSIEGDLWSTPFMTTRSVLGKKCPLGGTGYIIRKDVLEQIGLFDNHLVDDFELTFRLLRNNYKIAFAPLCVDYDEKPPTLDIMFRQRSRWAKGFLTLLKSRITEPSDLLGHISWLLPIATLASFVMLIIPAYSTVHYMLFEFYPYTYSYLPLDIWTVLTVSIYLLQAAVLFSEHGIKGLRYIPLLPIYNVFCQYCFVTYVKAFFVRSWAKTEHGFTTAPNRSVAI
jgi:cellulose synthase/poly-beta-1,6-N-acetylglucosamine synthase-like glycosyltransferase